MNKTEMSSVKVPVVVLAGGLGTRLRESIGNVPKVLAPVNDKPFLEVLLNWFESQRVESVTFSLGFESQQVITALNTLRGKYTFEIEYVAEAKPLGTLGGLAYTLSVKDIGECIVMNGDTFVNCDLTEFLAKQRNRDSKCALIATKVENVSRYGQLSFDVDNEVVSQFIEKQPENETAGWINAGLYYFSQDTSEDIKTYKTGGIENDFLTKNLSILNFYKVTTKQFIDIGTPSSLSNANALLKDLS